MKDLIHVTQLFKRTKVGDCLIVFRDQGELYGSCSTHGGFISGDEYLFRVKSLKLKEDVGDRPYSPPAY